MYNRSSERRWFLGEISQTHEQDLERIKSLRYLDDDFMTVCLADNYEGVERGLDGKFILRTEDM